MAFVNDDEGAARRVAAGADAGCTFKHCGFACVREPELSQEAGFHPLEVVQAATLNGAELPALADVIGSVVPGKRADVVLVGEKPVTNFKMLYGTARMRLDQERGEVVPVGGVRWTIRDGIVYDAPKLLADVRAMLAETKRAEGAAP